ncbi:MAG: adenylyl-sulfate kinase [Nitrospiraceae bacterium]|nr:MAG: adenylyl-sulfate kinase [Nitrospiraceae bacterium]
MCRLKGQYKKARAGIITNYTGIDAPYEEPEKPELIINTEKIKLESSVQRVLGLLVKKNFIVCTTEL